MLLISTVIIGAVVWVAARLIWPFYRSPLWSLPGPPPTNWRYGNFKQISTVRNSLQMQEWITSYGPNFLVRWLGSVCLKCLCVPMLQSNRIPLQLPCLWTVDPVTVAYILSRSYDYERPLEGRLQVARLMAKSKSSDFHPSVCAHKDRQVSSFPKVHEAVVLSSEHWH